MAKNRTSPKLLVSNSIALPCRRTRWIDRLQPDDRDYISEVADEAKKQPEAAINTLAYALIVELDLSVSTTTVARTLRELINGKA